MNEIDYIYPSNNIRTYLTGCSWATMRTRGPVASVVLLVGRTPEICACDRGMHGADEIFN